MNKRKIYYTMMNYIFKMIGMLKKHFNQIKATGTYKYDGCCIFSLQKRDENYREFILQKIVIFVDVISLNLSLE